MEAACSSDTSVLANKSEDYRVTALETLKLHLEDFGLLACHA
jgi:hypothetical protein